MGASSKHVVAAATAPDLAASVALPFTVRDVPTGDGPPESFALTTAEPWLRGEDSSSARRISVFSEADKRCVASALVTPAEESTLTASWGMPRSALERCVIISDVALDPGSEGVLPTLLYLCLRRARILERAVVVTAADTEKAPPPGGWPAFAQLNLEPLSNLPAFSAGKRTFAAHAQRVDIAIHRAFSAIPEDLRPVVRAQFVSEAVETLDRWIERFFQTPWFTAIREGTMTKEQYIYTLSNQHQFVRWTTRLIGLAVRHSHDRELRNKWLEHLSEEINHEVLIERDLAGLGADVDFVINKMVPIVKNQQFMVAQESMIGFHSDPVLFMGAPFAAEGFASRLDGKFIEATRRLVKSWGIENPKQVTTFFASHVEYDGGDDGHWEQTRRVLDRYLTDDTILQKFLNVLRLSMNAFEASYTAYVEDLAIFSAKPALH